MHKFQFTPTMMAAMRAARAVRPEQAGVPLYLPAIADRMLYAGYQPETAETEPFVEIAADDADDDDFY